MLKHKNKYGMYKKEEYVAIGRIKLRHNEAWVYLIGRNTVERWQSTVDVFMLCINKEISLSPIIKESVEIKRLWK